MELLLALLMAPQRLHKGNTNNFASKNYFRRCLICQRMKTARSYSCLNCCKGPDIAFRMTTWSRDLVAMFLIISVQEFIELKCCLGTLAPNFGLTGRLIPCSPFSLTTAIKYVPAPPRLILGRDRVYLFRITSSQNNIFLLKGEPSGLKTSA